MKDNQFDDFIKNRLTHQESPVPVNMWERIAAQKKDRKGGFKPRLYLLLAALMLIGSISSYILFTGTQNSKDIASAKGTTYHTVTKKESGRFPEQNRITTHATNGTQQDASAVTRDVSSREHDQTKTGINTKNKTEKKRSTHKRSRSRKTRSDFNDITANDIAKSAGLKSNSIDSLAKEQEKENSVSKPDSTAVAEAKQNGKSDDRFSIELYTAPNMPINGISATNKAYEQVLKSAGNMQLSYLFGARLNYEITKTFSAKIGVQYAQVNEKVAFTDSMTGTIVTSTNRYKNIGVPLLVTYKTGWFRNLDLAINTGIILNIRPRFKGALPSLSGQAVDLSNEDVYNRNASTTLYLSLDVSKHVNGRTDLFLEPWFNYRLKNMVTHYYVFNQKIHASGLALGLRYRLYKSEEH